MHKGLLKVAGVMALGAVGAVALGFQMTDVGHFSGFMLMAATFAIATLYVLWQARKSSGDL